MLIKSEDAILMEPDRDLGLSIIGGAWGEFQKTIPAVQAKVLVEALNLILLTDASNPVQDESVPLDADMVLGKPGTLVPNQIANLPVDENQEIAGKKLRVYELLLEAVLNIVRQSGFTLNEELIQAERLPAVCKIVQFLFEMQGYEDLIGLAGILESRDISPAERFIMCLHKFLGDEWDMEEFYLLIDDVSEVS